MNYLFIINYNTHDAYFAYFCLFRILFIDSRTIIDFQTS